MGASPVNRRPLVGSGQTENMRRHQGGRKRLFSPAEASNLGVLGKVVQLIDTATVEHQTR